MIELAMVPIPVVFYRYGHRIRERSGLIRRMRDDQEKLETKKRRAAEREERHRARENGIKEESKQYEKEDLDV